MLGKTVTKNEYQAAVKFSLNSGGLIQDEIRNEEEEIRREKAGQLRSQESWTKWQASERKLK